MKKQKFWLLCLTSCLIAVAIMFSRCKKSTEDLAINKNENQQCQQSEEDRLLEERILAFRDGGENARTTGQMDIEDAIWLIEATLNYTYGDNNPNYLARKRDSITLGLDTLNIANASNLYSVVLSELCKGFYADYFDNKKLTVVDLQLVTNGTKNDQEELIVYYETGDSETSGDTAVFNDTDWWYYGFSLGKCNGYNDSLWRDAATMLQDKLQLKISSDIPIYSPCPNARVYYTDIVDSTYIPTNYLNPNDSIPNDNYYDYIFYYNYNNYPNYHECLSPNEMNWYYYSIYYFIKNEVGGTNLDLRNIISFLVNEHSNKSLSAEHRIYLYYGEYHISCDENPIPLPDPIE